MADRLKAIILDFDGVIIESNNIKTEAFFEVFSRYPEHTAKMMEYHRAHVSASRFAKFQYFVDEVLGRSGDHKLVEKLASEFSAFTLERLKSCPFVPGAMEFLRWFSPRTALFLASVTPEEDLLYILGLRGLASYFRGVYGCPPWTKPTAIADVLSRLQAPPTEVILVGDSPGDRDAAEAAGMEFIARDSGIAFHPKPRATYRDMFDISAALKNRVERERN